MASSSTTLDDLVKKLRDLGISDRTARFALSRSNNNVEQAAEYVFSGRANKDEVSQDTLNMDQPSLSLEMSDTSPLQRSDSPTRWQLRGRFKRRLSPEVTSRVVGDLEPVDEKDPLSPSSHQLAAYQAQQAQQAQQTSILTQHTYPPPPSDHRSLEQQSNDLILAALGRGRTPTTSNQASNQPSATSTPTAHKPASGALAALGLRTAAVASPAVASIPQARPASPIVEPAPSAPSPPAPSKLNKSFLVPSKPIGGSTSRSASIKSTYSKNDATSRSPSPFFRARKAREERRERSPSPDIVALRKDSLAAESDVETVPGVRGRGRYRPRSSAYDSPDSSGNEADEPGAAPVPATVKVADKPMEKIVVPPSPHTDDDYDDDNADDEHEEPLDYDDDDLWDPETFFDEETEKNTEANAFYADPTCHDAIDKATKRDNFDVYGEDVEQDVLGEGPNVVVPPEPLFTKPGDKVRKSERSGLDLVTSRPTYARDRCTISLTQGDPDAVLDESGKRMRRYVVLSDLSEESRYAVEWAIGTVARDGDEVFLISVMENEDKVDPKSWSNKDQQNKIKVQKERQTTALLLVRQVTGLLERTRLNVTVTCQAMHAKNARYMLLDLIDFLEPTLVIVGSRGLGQLKGILLGSTSHYLVQKSSVPVMVARRRLRRPLRRTNPEDLRRSPRVSLASANIEKTAPKKQEDDVLDAADDDDVDPNAAKEREDDQ